MLNVRHVCVLMLATETLQEHHARATMAALDQRPLAADDGRGQTVSLLLLVQQRKGLAGAEEDRQHRA